MQPRTSDIYNCPLSDSVCEDIEDYICHIKAHADYEGAHTCSIEGCGKSFRKLRTLLRHMHQHHPVTEDPSNRHNLPFEAYCRARLPWFNSSMGLFMIEPVRLWREHLSHDQLRAVCSNCGNHVRLYERLGMCGIFGQWILHAVKVSDIS